MTHGVFAAPLGILAVYGSISPATTLGRAGAALRENLQDLGFEVITAWSATAAISAIQSDPLIGCVIVDADIDRSDGARAVLREFRGSNDRAPTFLFTERSHVPYIPLATLKLADDFVWPAEESPTIIAGRVEAAIRRYRDNHPPPMFASMLKQANVRRVKNILRLLQREHVFGDSDGDAGENAGAADGR